MNFDSFLLTQDESFCAPLIEELKTKVAEKEEKFTNKIDPMFNSPFCDPNKTLEEFIKLIRGSLQSENEQNRFFVGLVQATLSGKTRLILEASLIHPIVLISFKKGNSTYSSLLQSLSVDQTALCSDFAIDQLGMIERQFHNRVIMVKVKLFILAFMEFNLLYRKFVIGLHSKWADVDRMKKIILFALLINGGNSIVSRIFEKHIETLSIRLNENIETISRSIDANLESILQELGSPWLAFDECHVPQVHCIGCDCNYKDKEQWQQSERITPSRTNLFSAFRFIAEKLLLSPSSTMSIFATTQYSCWETNDRHNKPRIEFFSQLHILSKKDVRQILVDFYSIPEQLLDQAPADLMRIWQARPGFILDIAYPSFRAGILEYSNFYYALEKAKESAINVISCKFLNDLALKDLNILHYIIIMHNGTISDATLVNSLVKAGIAIKIAGSAIVCEDLVYTQLQTMLPKSIEKLEETMVSYLGSDIGERSVALQLVKFKGSVTGLMEAWGVNKQLSEKTKQYLDGFTLDFSVKP